MSEEDRMAVLDTDRFREFWAFLKVELAKKAGTADLADLVDTDLLAETLATALASYATKAEVTEALSGALSREVVDSLPNPTAASEKVIYMVPAPDATNQDVKDEYMLIGGKWEKLGSTRIDLTPYWSKAELRAMTADELTAILV